MEAPMTPFRTALVLLPALALLTAATLSIGASREPPARAATGAETAVPLKAAKLIVEQQRDRPRHRLVLGIEGRGALAKLGLTELFFETVEPENTDVPVEEMLAKLPSGTYTIAGPTQENGESAGRTEGKAVLTHAIPAGPTLVAPKEGAAVPVRGVVARWKPVTTTIDGAPVTIIAYQLIIEKDAAAPRNMIGSFGLSMYLRPSVTSVAVPNGFLEPRTAYTWEVLAIERSGNQTLSSGAFRTR
jgi:hypothetical protein